MEAEAFEKTKEELKKEIQKNNEQININDERKELSYVNRFEYKATKTVEISLLPYVGLVILSGILINNGIMPSLIETIPVESFPFIIAGSSLCVGTVIRKIIERKCKIKERLKTFTTANTESEKIQEEVKYAVELEKAKNRNKVIQETMDSLSSTQSMLNSLSSRYDIDDRTIPKTEEEAKKSTEDLSIRLKDKYAELDVLTTQRILHEKFCGERVKTKGKKVIDIVKSGVIGGFFIMMCESLPFIVLRSHYIAPRGLMYLLTSPFTPFIAGTIGIGGYMIKRSKDYIKAFNNLNNELGENALPDKIKEVYEERQNLDNKIVSKIKEISVIETQLQEHKRIMESFSTNRDDTNSNDKEKTMEQSVSGEYNIEDSKNDIIFECSQEDWMTFMDEDIFTGAERESQEEEKGTQLVFKRKINNTQNPQK